MEQLVPDLLEAHGLVLTGSSVHGLPDQGIGDEADEDVSPDPFRRPVGDGAHLEVMLVYPEGLLLAWMGCLAKQEKHLGHYIAHPTPTPNNPNHLRTQKPKKCQS